MILQGLISALSRASTFDDALAFAGRDADFSLTEGLQAPLLAGLLGQRRAPALFVITATGRESEALRDNIAGFACDATPCTFKMPRKSEFGVTISKDGYKTWTGQVTTRVSGAGGAGMQVGGGAFTAGVLTVATGITVTASSRVVAYRVRRGASVCVGL